MTKIGISDIHDLAVHYAHKQPEPWLTPGPFAFPGVKVDPGDALITGAQAARRFGFSRGLVNKWRHEGRIVQQPCGRYLYRDVQRVERETRTSGKAHRGPRQARELANA